MNVTEIAEYMSWTEARVLASKSRELGTTTQAWRCGQTGRISEGEHDCSCDSVLCGLGEQVTISPAPDE